MYGFSLACFDYGEFCIYHPPSEFRFYLFENDIYFSCIFYVFDIAKILMLFSLTRYKGNKWKFKIYIS